MGGQCEHAEIIREGSTRATYSWRCAFCSVPFHSEYDVVYREDAAVDAASKRLLDRYEGRLGALRGQLRRAKQQLSQADD